MWQMRLLPPVCVWSIHGAHISYLTCEYARLSCACFTPYRCGYDNTLEGAGCAENEFEEFFAYAGAGECRLFGGDVQLANNTATNNGSLNGWKARVWDPPPHFPLFRLDSK